MSLKEAYTMAHSAQCRLQMEAGRPERNLRFVVGHLMHYESLRLRIVEIEHDISKSQRASAVAFKGTGHVDHHLQPQRKPSTGQLGGRKSPPPPAAEYDSDSDDSDDQWSDHEDDDGHEAGDDLGLQRFPSGTARPPQPPPDLMPDDEFDDDEDDFEPVSPEEPDQETLENLIKNSDGSTEYANMYNSIKKCPCHHKQDAPAFEKFWELPPDQANAKEGVTRAIAQVYV